MTSEIVTHEHGEDAEQDDTIADATRETNVAPVMLPGRHQTTYGDANRLSQPLHGVVAEEQGGDA